MFQKIVKFCIYALVFLTPLFWLPFSAEAFDFNKVYLLFFLTSVGIIGWIGEMIFEEKRLSFRRTPLDFVVLGFAVALGLSTIFSVDKPSSLLGSYGRFWPSLLGTFSLCGFYFLLSNHISFAKPQKEERSALQGTRLLKVFLTSSFLVVVTAYLSIFGLFAKLGQVFTALPTAMKFQGFNTMSGSLEALSIFLAFIIVLVVTAVAFRKRIAAMFASKKGTFCLYLLLFTSLLLLLIIGFRTAWLVLALSLVLFLVIAFWKRIFRQEVHRLDLPIVLLLIALIFIFTNPLRGFFGQIGVLNNLPAEIFPSQRLSWQVNWQGFKSNLVVGSGPSTFDYLFNKFKPRTFLQNPGILWRLRLDRPGSHIAETLGTGGVLGTLSYLALLGMFFLLFYFFLAHLKTKTKSAGEEAPALSEEKFIAIPLLSAVLALLLGQVFYYQNATLAFSFWFCLALGVLALSPEGKRKEFAFEDFPEVGLVLSIFFWVVLIAFVFSYFNLGKYYLADVYYRNYAQDPAERTQDLERAVRLADLRSTYHIVLAQDYLGRFNQEIVKTEPSPQVAANMAALALQEAKRATEVSPNKVASQETLSVVYRDIQVVAQGAFEWSLKAFEEALKLEPKNPALLTELGKLVAVKEPERAKQFFQEAVNLKSDYFDAHLQLALLAESQGNNEEAKTILENAVSLNPQSVEGRFQLGRIYYNRQENDKAKEQLETAIAIFPNHSNSLYSLALVYEKEGDEEKAIELLEKVLELNPGNTEITKKLSELRGSGQAPLPPQPVAPAKPEEKE